MVGRITEVRYDNVGSGGASSDYVEFIIPTGETDTYEIVTVESNGNEKARFSVDLANDSVGQTTLDGVTYEIYTIGNGDSSGLNILSGNGVGLANITDDQTEEFISFGQTIQTSSGSVLPNDMVTGANRPTSIDIGTTTNEGSLVKELNAAGTDLETTYTAIPLAQANPGTVPSGGVVCLTQGTLIECRDGQLVAVENLEVGDWVKTRTHGYQQLRWVGHRSIGPDTLTENPKLRPVRIAAGALGNGLPERDLIVSRQHRMLVDPWMTSDQGRRDPVLIAAIKLVELDGVEIDGLSNEVTYFHLMFDQHEVIFAEGAPTESLYAGPEALKTLNRWALKELTTLFPELKEGAHLPEPVAHIPTNKEQKSFVEGFKQHLAAPYDA